MISEKMKPFMANNSAIRAMFEEGKRMAAIYGKENVYDFSLGNPNVPVPQVTEAILDVVKNEDFMTLHGYMSNAGFEDVRQTIADSLNKRFGTNFSFKNLIMTVGAASGLNIILKSILNPGDEVIVFAPYFVEYNAYVRNYDGNVVIISPDTETFMPKLDEFEAKITAKTKAVIINNPNNPSGVVYNKETLIRLQKMLEKAEERIGHPIYVLSDEPYRELVYDGCELPFAPDYIKNCIVGYSFSKSLSLSGERIGYMAVSPQIAEYDTMINALVVANRCIGYINAPSLFQLVVADCLDVKTDVEFYDRNRKLLYESMKDMGFECVKPEGAFYMLVKAPTGDDAEFSAEAKKFNLLIVPATSFGCPGYVRMAYCVSNEMIHRALPALQKLADHYGLKK